MTLFESTGFDTWTFVQENIGLVKSVTPLLTGSSFIHFHDVICFALQVLESVWLVVTSNVHLLMSIMAAVVSLILGSGSAIFNFVIAFVSDVIKSLSNNTPSIQSSRNLFSFVDHIHNYPLLPAVGE